MRYVMNIRSRVAGAGGGGDDGDVLVPRRRRGVPRQRAHRRGGAAQCGAAGGARARCCWVVRRCMLVRRRSSCSATASSSCSVTWHQTIAEFPSLSVGVVYLPIPIGGLLTLLFLVETASGSASRRKDDSIMYRDQAGGRWSRPMDILDPARLASSLLCALGVPVAYALGLAALIARALGRHPARGGDAQDLRRHRRLLAAGDPVLRAGRRDHGRGRHGGAAGQPAPRCSSASSAAAWRWSTSSPSTFFGCISGSSVADTASIGSVMIPQMVKQGYPRVFATNVTICGSVQALLIPPSHNAVIYSLAAGGTISVAHLFLAGVLPGLLFGAVPDRPGAVDRAQARLPEGRAGAAASEVPKIVRRRAVGPGHDRHHHGRHPVRRLHADRIGRGRLRLRVPRHDVRLPRLQVARAAAAACTAW